MGETSKISWCHSTMNPFLGCVEVSPACDNCYAREMMDTRYHRAKWGKDQPRPRTSEAYWKQPLAWNKKAEATGEPWRVFCGSLCDVMEFRADLDPIRADLFSLIDRTPFLTWLLLTKRPQNFRRLVPPSWLLDWPDNVWPMTTVESPAYLHRIGQLRTVPAAIRGLSIEPLLEPLPELAEHLAGISWVITGAESGKVQRPMQDDWVRVIRDACVASGTSFFHKQQIIKGIKVETPFLDGRQWTEFPGMELPA